MKAVDSKPAVDTPCAPEFPSDEVPGSRGIEKLPKALRDLHDADRYELGTSSKLVFGGTTRHTSSLRLFTPPDDEPNKPRCGTPPQPEPEPKEPPCCCPSIPLVGRDPTVESTLNTKAFDPPAGSFGDDEPSYPNIPSTPPDLLQPGNPYIDPNSPADPNAELEPLSAKGDDRGSGNGSNNGLGNGSSNDIDVHIDKVEVNLPSCELVRDPYGNDGSSGGNGGDDRGSHTGDGGKD